MASGQYDGVSPGKKKPKRILAVLLSCCIFLAIICACLIAALVMIGKHIMNNTQRGAASRQHVIHNPIRLASDTKPVLYDVTLLPDLDRGSYNGSVNVTIELSVEKTDIKIHSQNLTIVSVELSSVNGSTVFEGITVQELPEDEVLVIRTSDPIPPGMYYLVISFNGSLLGKLQGFYRSYYKAGNNGTISSNRPYHPLSPPHLPFQKLLCNAEELQEVMRQMATSKFEPTYARQAFPCFDEPNMKARFKVHLLRPKDESYRALSNYPQIGEEEVDNGILVHFEETVPMSTYLSCFIVSDFTFTETDFYNEDEKIPFRVYASPGQLEKTQYAGRVGRNAIEFYINYFNIPYPLPKLDMVAIPDFVSGAMEHWGLVTYRETALLYTKRTHSSTNKQRVATVVAHELAHSWFGNLVTMDWWDNLWLNEGFATYIQYKGVNASEPDWQMLDQFLVADLHPVLDLDGTTASHPIIQKVTTPDQITEVFDTISYSKGASILRMLENAVGGDAFREGVTNYLNKYKYSNAVTQYLWNELQAVVGEGFNITYFMDTYTVQMGYPLVNVTIDEESKTVTLKQKWFLTNPDTISKAAESPYGYKWTIPVRYISNLNKTESEIIWFPHDNEEVVFNLPDGIEWIKFNPKQVGYYRVNYDKKHWYSLLNIVHELEVADRTHLLEEMFSLAEAGVINYTMTLDLTTYLKREFDYLPWAVAATKLEEIATHFTGSDKEADFKKYVKTIVEPAYRRLSWNERDDDSHLTRLARVVVLRIACSIGHEQCLAEAKETFVDWLENKTALSPDLRGLIYEYGMETIDEKGWNKVLEIFSNETDANEKLKLLNGLANVRDPALLSKLINLAKNESFVRKQDYFTCLKYIASNPLGTPIVWDYVRDQWMNLVARFTLNDRYLGRLIPSITETFSTEVKLEEMTAFFTKYQDAGAGASARLQAIDNVKNNIIWLSKYKSVVEDWLVRNHF